MILYAYLVIGEEKLELFWLKCGEKICNGPVCMYAFDELEFHFSEG